MSTDDDLSRLSLEELFQQEAQTQSRVLTDGLLALERSPGDAITLEACMRAAHSLKGAARIVGLQRGVDIAHRMEDCFVHAQQGLIRLRAEHIDRLLEGVDPERAAGIPGDEHLERLRALDGILEGQRVGVGCLLDSRRRLGACVHHGAAQRQRQ